MKLRGDLPDVCTAEETRTFYYGDNVYDKFKRQSQNDLQALRHTPRIMNFLYRYHYHGKTRVFGNELTTWEINPKWVPFITCLLEKMQLDLTHKEIAIECNPSSNVLIGTLKNYENHPVFRFYNDGIRELYPDYTARKMDVSINTDDLGVFATSIENEYAIIARALEKEGKHNEKLAPSTIFEYLDKLREMGNRQSFK